MKQSGPFNLTTTGATPATGIATLTKDPADTCVLAVISGTYGTVQIKFLGSIDGTNYFPVEAEDLSNGNLVNGTLSPSDNSVHAYRILADGLINVQVYTVAIASGTAVITGQGQHFVNLPKTSNQSAGSSTGASSFTGDVTLSDVNLILGTVTGTKIGTATTQKLGFYNATPIVQPANTVDYVTMLTNLGLRATGVTLSKMTGGITLFSAAGSATPATFTVTNTLVAATDTIIVSQQSGTDAYTATVSAVAAGSYKITIVDLTGTTTEAPVFNATVIKGVAA